jgi:muramoyltetrapeptide carboxypeptidase LdcA involved in peptidoglycan recycling
MIFCAIGGDDTYRLLPYLFDEDKLKSVVNDKIFLGFSDTTINPSLPVLCNVNIGHAAPRCIIPFGVNATVDAGKQVIRF